MRMGMFSENVSRDTPQERYLLFINDQQWQAPPNYFNSGSFDYLARNYYYREQSQLFLEKISSITHQKGKYTLKRVLISDSATRDTVTVASHETAN